MHFELNEDQAMLQQTLREFCDSEVAPKAAEIDRTAEFPMDTFKSCAEMGLTGVYFPEEYGGAAMDRISYALVVEELSRACASTGVIISVQNSLAGNPIYKFGTEEQKKKYLTGIATGDMVGCYCLTEPGAGSDAGDQRTTAEKKGDHWVLNGEKIWVTNGNSANVAIVYANMDRSKKHKGVCAFIVDTSTPGFTKAKDEDKLGIRASGSCSFHLENVEVPAENLLHEECKGFSVAMATLDGGRVGIAAQSVGIAQAALEAAVKYSQERETFGTKICNHQAIQFKLADMATELDAARLLTYRAAWLQEHKGTGGKEASMAKLYASQVSNRAAYECVQIFGGMGYSKEYVAERLFRDARITEIYEGTSEIQRIVIARGVLNEYQ